MNENLTGWGAPPEDAAPPVETVEAIEPEAPPVDGAEPEAATEPEPEAPVYLGKFKTPEEMADAYRNLEQQYGHLANEYGKVKPREEPPQPAGTSYQSREEAERDLALNKSIAELATGEHDAVLSQLVGRDVSQWGEYDYMKWQMRTEQTLEAQQFQAQQFQSQVQQTFTTYISANPDLADNPFLEMVDDEYAANPAAMAQFQTIEQYIEAVGTEARKRAQAYAARILGQAGGKAAAEKRAAGVVPGSGIPGGGVPASTAPDPNRFRVGWGNPD